MSEQPWWPLEWQEYVADFGRWDRAFLQLPNGLTFIAHDYSKLSNIPLQYMYHVEVLTLDDSRYCPHNEYFPDLFELKCFLAAQAAVDTQPK